MEYHKGHSGADNKELSDEMIVRSSELEDNNMLRWPRSKAADAKVRAVLGEEKSMAIGADCAIHVDVKEGENLKSW